MGVDRVVVSGDAVARAGQMAEHLPVAEVGRTLLRPVRDHDEPAGTNRAAVVSEAGSSRSVRQLLRARRGHRFARRALLVANAGRWSVCFTGRFQHT